ncbi:MAG: response regulator transcription factor [Phycisphaerae bacterium]|nr:response regulator transcription factor [Phycisphaerae bacterium]
MTTATGVTGQHVPLTLSVDRAVERLAGLSFAGVRVCLIGGQRIIRSVIQDYLQGQGVEVATILEDEQALLNAGGNGGLGRANLLVLIVSGGAFRTFHILKPFLDGASRLPMVVLSDQVSRGQVYTALRMGAKAFVNLNADPSELLTAIRMASAQKVYLAPEAAELLVTDISDGVKPPRARAAGATNLSRRELEIVQLLCEGLSSKEIAGNLHLSTKTVENHRYNIYRKCEVDSIAGLMRHAVHHGLVAI